MDGSNGAHSALRNLRCDMEELKPCPFCGSDKIIMCIDLWGPQWMSHLMCDSCCATKGSDVFPTQDESELATISEWNRRTNEGESHD